MKSAITLVSKILFLIAIAVAFMPQAAWARDCFVYFGTFTGKNSKGIYLARLDMANGKLSPARLAAKVENPNYLAVSTDSRFLFAVSRSGNKAQGTVDVFSIDPRTGMLTLRDRKSSGGIAPSYVGLDPADHALLVSNYGSGCVKSFHLDADGALVDATVVQHHGHGVNPVRQQSPHPHCFVAAPAGRFALSCDLGLDKVLVYKISPANAVLTPNDPPFVEIKPGSGPRHIAFSPDGKTAAVISEMACTVTVFDWDGKRGILRERQSLSVLPAGQYKKSFTAAEIAYRPDGRFVYATTRGHNSISVFSVDRESGRLALVQNIPCGGNFPRGMGIDSSGRWLIVGNQNSGNVAVFGINAVTGKLAPTGQSMKVGVPVDVKFAAADPE